VQYGKKYKPEEDKYHMKVFMENKYKIIKHNAAYEKGQHSFKLGMNQYGDMVNENPLLVFLSNVIVGLLE
jgi:cathepsin L